MVTIVRVVAGSLVNDVVILDDIILQFRSKLVELGNRHTHIQSPQNVAQILVTVQSVWRAVLCSMTYLQHFPLLFFRKRL